MLWPAHLQSFNPLFSNNPPTDVSKNPAEIHGIDQCGYGSSEFRKRKKREEIDSDGLKKRIHAVAGDWENSVGSNVIKQLAGHLGLTEDSTTDDDVIRISDDELDDNLTKEKDTEELKNIFNLLDKDKDGYITTEELVLLGESPFKVQSMIDRVNPKLGGKIDFPEFLKLMDSSEEQLIKDFEEFDKGQTGFISAEVLRYVMTSFGEEMTGEEVDEMIKDGDADANGQINYKKFLRKICGN
ncbi:OLC1v1036383C1 [Oldenlandia corymbosa var. corymbosa]|uniref:OLC1v1036383C1 n=1 Tax=Oldenlandia corymbosa var. corymbosa TaxID=529605 RepID=A0AAV1CWM0_OLDCO|nr:OLC1v1036383C1 [Oldenlandia corymbosa var. corymbosa]